MLCIKSEKNELILNFYSDLSKQHANFLKIFIKNRLNIFSNLDIDSINELDKEEAAYLTISNTCHRECENLLVVSDYPTRNEIFDVLEKVKTVLKLK